jgi:hypothetical protein
VQARVDLLAVNHRGLATVRDRSVELRVGRAEQQRTIVRVRGIEELGIDPVRRVVDRRDGEGDALGVVGVRSRRTGHGPSFAGWPKRLDSATRAVRKRF